MAEPKSFRPSAFQPELPVEQIILQEPPSNEGVAFDVLFVGAGPAALAGAVKLAQLVKTENEKTNGSLGNVTIGVVEKSAEVGHHILSGAVINPDCIVGDFAIINTGVTLDHDCTVGQFAHVSPGCVLAGGVRVGAGTLLGVGCKAVPGAEVGDWATLGAGSVIIHDIPDGAVAFGVPAKVKE